MTTPEQTHSRDDAAEMVARARPDQIARLLDDLRHPERDPSDARHRLQ